MRVLTLRSQITATEPEIIRHNPVVRTKARNAATQKLREKWSRVFTATQPVKRVRAETGSLQKVMENAYHEKLHMDFHFFGTKIN